jgi:hypothetical protein
MGIIFKARFKAEGLCFAHTLYLRVYTGYIKIILQVVLFEKSKIVLPRIYEPQTPHWRRVIV